MSSPASPDKKPSAGAEQEINWGDYRDHLATAHQDGSRKWVYAKKPCGTWTTRRKWFAWALIAIMFAGPFIRISGNPLLMINIVERKFSILGQIFWPEDSIIFAVSMLLYFAGIMVFTTVFGRLWCGWACPQTVMMEMVFRPIEYLIEGDAQTQRASDKLPWKGAKLAKKLLKHAIFLFLSFVVGNTLLSYIIGSEQMIHISTDDPRNHLVGLTFMIAFTLLFYGIFARFREQACTFICPYGRFMSALIDENTMVVAYDHTRGEKRGPLKRDLPAEQREAAGLGDCVDCHQCVAVCPTGIDIRDGTQMECVNCTACIDACDTVMTKVGKPKGLIRYASLDGIQKGQPLRFTARMKLYSVIICGLVTLLAYLVFTRAEVETLFLRASGSLFQKMPDGKFNNLYTVKVINKCNHDLPIEFRLENIYGKLTVMGSNKLVAPKEKLAETSVMIELSPEQLQGSTTALVIGVYSSGNLLETVKTTFVGPRPDQIIP
jgi:cytochrome c oxidase accessory protein FixG